MNIYFFTEYIPSLLLHTEAGNVVLATLIGFLAGAIAIALS